MKDNNTIALSGHAAKWIDLFSTGQTYLHRDYCISILGCYSWTYAEWWEKWPEGRWIMQADYNATMEWLKEIAGK